MLSDALKELRHFVLEDNGDDKKDEEIIATLERLNQKHNIPASVNLQEFMFYFTELKLALIEKGLQKEDGTFKDTASKDWVPAERKIAWYYIQYAHEEEGVGKTKCLDFAAEILEKTTPGVRAKVYEIQNKVKEGAKVEEVFYQGRGGKIVQFDANKVKNKLPKNDKTKKKDITTKENAASVDNVETNVTNDVVVENTETPVLSESVSADKKVVNENTNIAPSSEVQANVSSSNLYTQEELLEMSPKITLQDQTNIGKSLSGIIKNLHGMTRVVSDDPNVIDPIDNIQIANFFIGFEKFLEYGSKYVEVLPKFEAMEKRIAELENELKAEKELTDTLHKNNKELSRALENRAVELEKVFNNIKNAHNTFITKEDFERYQYLPNYETNMKIHINRLEEIIEEEKELSEGSSENKWAIDLKDNFLRKLS